MTPAIGDMILRQPDNIVHEILTHLDLSDLVRTSVLSKPWRYLWITSSPNLIFDRKFFDSRGFDRENRLRFAEQTLGIRSRNTCCRFSLRNLVLADVSLQSERDITCLDNCIRYAIACDVKRLELRVGRIFQQLYLDWPYEQHYLLPPTLFTHASLVELKLYGCMLRSSSFPTNMTLPCLKVLRIALTAIVDSMKLIEHLIASSPLIEDLTLSSCFGCNGVLKIVNNPELINVTIRRCSFERIVIDAPGLQSFRFCQARVPCDLVMSSCKNIIELELEAVDNVSAFANNLFNDLPSRLLHLESLVLSFCSMETIKFSSSTLKRLKLIGCQKLVRVEVDDPNLTLFRYQGKNMIYFVSNALNLSVDITLHTIPSNVETVWFIEFVEFIGRFNTAKSLALSLYDDSDKIVILPEEMRASVLPPLYNVEHLVLKLRRESLTETFDEIMDELLWLSPHPITISFASYGEKILKLAFLYDEIDGEGKCSDRYSSLITCSRHCFKGIKIKNYGLDEVEVKKNIKSFFDHALSLRKFEDL